jgi:hypothetical protein
MAFAETSVDHRDGTEQRAAGDVSGVEPGADGADSKATQAQSGHASRTSAEIYSRLALAEAQQTYDRVITAFPV